MKIISHQKEIIEIQSNEVLISSPSDILSIFAESSKDIIILKKENFSEEFFDLSTRLAGEVLQKVSNYRKKIAIVGDFTNIKNKALRDFIYESNKNKQVLFVSSVEEAVEIFFQ